MAHEDPNGRRGFLRKLLAGAAVTTAGLAIPQMVAGAPARPELVGDDARIHAGQLRYHVRWVNGTLVVELINDSDVEMDANVLMMGPGFTPTGDHVIRVHWSMPGV